MSQLTALQNSLSAAIKNQSLTLDQSLLDATLLKPFPQGAIALEQVTLTLQGKALLLTGDLQDNWQPPGLSALLISQLSLSATFTETAKGLTATFSFVGVIIVDGKTINITGSVSKEKIQFGLASEQKLPLAVMVSVISNKVMDGSLPALSFLNSVMVETFNLGFAFDGKSATDIELVAGIDASWDIIAKTLSVGNLKTKIELSYAASTDGGEYSLFYSGSLQGSMKAGVAYQVEVPFTASQNLDIIITAQQADATPGILDIAKLIGGAELRTKMKTALTTVKLTELSVDKLTISFDTTKKKPRYMLAEGHMVLAGVNSQLSVQIPGAPSAKNAAWIINASAAQKKAIPIGQLVNDLSSRYGKLTLPDMLESFQLSNLSLSVNTATQSIAVGFDSQMAIAGQKKLDTHIQLALAKSGKAFSKTFNGYVLFNGLQFALDFSSAPNSTQFSASFNNSQNSPSNVGLPGYGAPVPSSGKLFDVISQMFPASLSAAIPDLLKQSLNTISVSDSRIAIGNVAAVSYQSISLSYQKQGTKTNWKVAFVGGVELSGVVDLDGQLQIDIGENNVVEFIAAADSGQLPSIPMPLPVSGKAPTLEAKFKSIRFSKQAENFEFVSSVAVQFKGFSGLLDDILPDSSEATLTIKNKVQTLTITRLTDGVEIPLPNIPVPGKKDIVLGKMLLNLTNFSINTGAAPSLSVDMDIGLPSQLNNIFGTSGGKPNFELFNTYRAADPVNSVVKTRVASDGKKLSMQLINSPLKAAPTITIDGKSWWAIDMGDFGAANVMVPEFSYISGSTGLTASGGFDIVRPLSIPLTPLKWFLEAVFSKEVADAVPSAVPLKEINILNKNDELNVNELKKLWGGNFPSEVDSVLDVINDGVDKLPDRLKSYFNIQIPKSLLFDIQIDSTGGIQGSLSVKKDDPPLRILYPSMAGPLPALCGLELRKVAFGEILSGQLFTLEVDATFDQFNILTIAASLAMPNSDLNILPKSQNLQTTLEIKNLFAVIFYQAGVPIPIPLFYDLIGIDYLGFEGLGVGSHFKFPKPTLNVAELAKTLSHLLEFFTDPKYLLDSKNPPKDMDLAFTIGGNYLQLPNYTGGKLLGKKTTIETISAWKLLAHSLNWMKTFSVNEFVQSFPIQYRVGNETISFFNVAGINVAWALTTPHEFVTVAYKKLKIPAQDTEGVLALLPKQANREDEGLVLLMRGGFVIANTVKFQSTFGIMGSSAQGFATGFQHKGSIAKIVSAELSGAVAINPKSQPAFQLIGKTNLTILQQTVMSGELYLSNQELFISGLIDLFPGIKAVSAKAQIEGIVSSKQLKLTGDTNFAFGNATIIKGQLVLSQSEFYIAGQFLALKTTLQISQVNQALSIKGTVGTQLKFGVTTGAIRIAGVKVADGMSINIDAALALAIAVSSEEFALGVKAKFKLNGKGFDVSLMMHVVPKQIGDVTKELTDAIINEIEKYFKAIYKDAAAWAEGVASGAITFADNTAKTTAKVFKSVYKSTAQETTRLLKSAGHAVEDIGGALQGIYGQTDKQVTKLLKDAGYAAEEVGKALESAFSVTAEEAAKLLKGAGYTAEQVGKALESAFNQTAAEAAKLLKGAGYAAEQVGKALQSVYKQTAQQAAKLLKGAGYAAEQVGKALQSAYKQSAQQAAKLLKGAGYTAEQVGKALQGVYKQTAKQAAKLLKGAGYIAADVGKALKSVFKSSASAAASAMKSAGYTANQVGSALKSGFSLGAGAAAKALKGAGYTVDQVGGAIKGTFTNSAAAAASALKSAGYSASQAAKVMKNTFGASANEVAKVMKGTFGLGSSAVKGILKGVKFSSGAIAGVMKDIFNIIPFVKLPHIKHVKLPHIKHIKIPHVKIF